MNHADIKYIQLQNELARNFQPTSVCPIHISSTKNILIQLFWISNIEAPSKFFIDRKINNCLLTSEADIFMLSSKAVYFLRPTVPEKGSLFGFQWPNGDLVTFFIQKKLLSLILIWSFKPMSVRANQRPKNTINWPSLCTGQYTSWSRPPTPQRFQRRTFCLRP